MADIPAGQCGQETDLGVKHHFLMPLERVAYRMAKEQIVRGENPPMNTTSMLVLTIARLIGDEDGKS